MMHETYKQLVNVFIATHESDFRVWLNENSTLDVDIFMKNQEKRNIRYITDLSMMLNMSPIQLMIKAKNACQE